MINIKKTAFALVVALTAGYGVYTSQQKSELSELALANIEALANGEDGNNCKWKRVKDSYGCTYHVCVMNGDGDSCTCGSTQG